MAASADEPVPTTAEAYTGGVDASIAMLGNTATTTDYITGVQATPAVRCDVARAASADDSPPVDRDAT